MAMPMAALPAFAADEAPHAAAGEAAPAEDVQGGADSAAAPQEAPGVSQGAQSADSAEPSAPTDSAASPAETLPVPDAAPESDAAVSAEADRADAASAVDAAPTTAFPSALRTIDAIDADIAALGSYDTVAAAIAAGGLSQEQEKLFLQRSLIKDAGYDALHAFAAENQHNSDFLQWLLSDYETLQLYVTGGRPGGCAWRLDVVHASHERSIRQFMDIARAHAEDLTTGSAHDRLVFKKMMISAALGMNDDTRLWTGGGYPAADPVQRYEIVKTFRAHADRYRFQKDLFDQLPVENMRWVFENRIANEEMPWLANYSLGRYPDASQEGSRLNAYSYIEYRKDYNYGDPLFYDVASLYTQAVSKEPNDAGQLIPGGWAAKYRFVYDDANFPNAKEGDEFYLSNATDPRQNKQRLWIPFESGGVCGAVSKTCENLHGIVGVPATVAGQPGHAMCLTYGLVDDNTGTQASGKAPFYRILNDSGASWLRGHVPEINHMLCGWCESHSEQKNPDGSTQQLTTRYGGATYVLMAQDALNDMDGYTKVWELRQLADAQASIDAKLAVYDKALEVQPFNWDVITATIGLYKQKGASQDEWVALADRTAQGCAEYPYPMHSFMVRIEQEAADPMTTVRVEHIRLTALEAALSTTAAETVQYEVVRDTANRLLGRFSTKMFYFSFDGDEAGVLKLGPQFDAADIPWRFSLDGGAHWTEVTDGAHAVTLSSEQMESITAEQDILTQVIGIDETYRIDIAQGQAPTKVWANNGDNRVYGPEDMPADMLQVQVDGSWVGIDRAPAFADDQQVEVRVRATGTATASKDTATVSFESTWDVPDTRYVPLGECSVNAVSSTYNGMNASRVVNGYVGSSPATQELWHSLAEAGGPWVTVDLGKERDLSHIEMWVRADRPANGVPYKVEVLAAPEQGLAAGEAVPEDRFAPVGEFTGFDWMNPGGMPDQMRQLKFDQPVRARYVRVHALESRANFLTLAELGFYEKKADAVQAAVSATAPAFSDKEAGYESVEPAPLLLSNAGDDDAVIDAVESSSEAFAVTEGDRTVAAGAVNDTWKIAPVAGLEEGSYEADVTVRYHSASNPEDALTAQAKAAFTVSVAPDGGDGNGGSGNGETDGNGGSGDGQTGGDGQGDGSEGQGQGQDGTAPDNGGQGQDGSGSEGEDGQGGADSDDGIGGQGAEGQGDGSSHEGQGAPQPAPDSGEGSDADASPQVESPGATSMAATADGASSVALAGGIAASIASLAAALGLRRLRRRD